MLFTTRSFRIFLLIVVLLAVARPATARAGVWTPFLNDFSPRTMNEMYSLQDNVIAETIADYISDQLVEGLYRSPPEFRLDPSGFQASYWKNTRPFQCWSCVTGSGNRQYLNFPEIKRLVQSKLLNEGFLVRNLGVYANEQGFHISWDVEASRPADSWTMGQYWQRGPPIPQQTYQVPPRGEDIYGGRDEQLCKCPSTGWCQLKAFLDSPIDFIRNNL